MPGFVLVGGWPASGKTTVARALARERYRRRVRDARHLDDRRTEDELWGADVAPPGVGPLIEVDTVRPVDVTALATLIRSTLDSHHQRSQCTTSSSERRSGRSSGRSGRSAG